MNKAIELLDKQIKEANSNRARLVQQLTGVERAIECARAKVQALEEARASLLEMEAIEE